MGRRWRSKLQKGQKRQGMGIKCARRWQYPLYGNMTVNCYKWNPMLGVNIHQSMHCWQHHQSCICRPMTKKTKKAADPKFWVSLRQYIDPILKTHQYFNCKTPLYNKCIDGLRRSIAILQLHKLRLLLIYTGSSHCVLDNSWSYFNNLLPGNGYNASLYREC